MLSIAQVMDPPQLSAQAQEDQGISEVLQQELRESRNWTGSQYCSTLDLRSNRQKSNEGPCR